MWKRPFHLLRGLATANYAVERARTAWGRAFDWIRHGNFILLSSVRSGTTMMLDYLNCHDRIHCCNEILGPGHLQFGFPYQMSAARLRLHVESHFVKRPGRMTGAKIMTFHLDELPIKLADLLELLNQPKIIVLYRANILEQFVSFRMASQTGVWHVKKPKATPPIRIDPDECQAFVDRERRMWHENMTVLAGREAHVLSYEYLAARPDAAMCEVFGYLGVEAQTVRTRWVRTNPRPARLKVTNYAQLADRGLPRTAVQRLPYLAGVPARLAA